VFERFTDRARRVVVLAQEEARRLNHNYIGTEHLLLGLVHQRDAAAARALESLGISLQSVREQVEEFVGRGQIPPAGHVPFTPRGKKVLELSLREALRLGHNYIGTEHVLLGLLREGEGMAAQLLTRLGAGLDDVREAVMSTVAGLEEEESVTLDVLEADEAAQAAGMVAHIGRLDNEVLLAIARARDVARDLGHPATDVAHLLVAIAAMTDTLGGQALAGSGGDATTLQKLLPRAGQGVAAGSPVLTPQAAVLLYRASRRRPATTATLLTEIVASGGVLERDLLRRAGVDLDDLQERLRSA
jgi:ATP-dependent Clp protease ATP-binding subunit ClpA